MHRVWMAIAGKCAWHYDAQMLITSPLLNLSPSVEA